jgi:hypothetical protein
MLTAPKARIFRLVLFAGLLVGASCGDAENDDAAAGAAGATSTGAGAGSASSAQGGQDAQGGQGGQGGELPSDDCDPISLDLENQLVPMAQGCPSPTCTATGLTPLSDLGAGDFLGVPGGLYCGGSNLRPTFHDARGVSLASAIQPRASDGQIDTQNGRVVLVSIGMSNTSQEFGAFLSSYGGRPELSDRLALVNGALGGQASEAWSETELPWDNLDQVLANASLTHAQVAAVWIKLTHLEGYSVCGNDPPFEGPTACFPAGAKKLYDDMVIVLQRVKTTFPNVAIAYLSGRVYGGYANGGPSPDPFAYASSFAMKALILDQITGANPAVAEPLVPWLAWGPYLWADGLTPRSDGLTWAVSDFEMDGIHPSQQGRAKVADQLWGFLSTDATATPWFLDP